MSYSILFKRDVVMEEGEYNKKDKVFVTGDRESFDKDKVQSLDAIQNPFSTFRQMMAEALKEQEEAMAEALKRLTRMDDDERIRRNRAASDAWHKVNVEKNRAASRKFYSLNKSKVKVYHHRRRAQLHAAEGSVSAGREGQLMKLQQGKCACCRVSLKEVKHHIDHMTALSRGGSNDNSNLQLLCATCNLQKGAKDPIAFMQLKGFLL